MCCLCRKAHRESPDSEFPPSSLESFSITFTLHFRAFSGCLWITVTPMAMAAIQGVEQGNRTSDLQVTRLWRYPFSSSSFFPHLRLLSTSGVTVTHFKYDTASSLVACSSTHLPCAHEDDQLAWCKSERVRDAGFIDSFGKRVYTEQFWETKLCKKNIFGYLLLNYSWVLYLHLHFKVIQYE